jgi:elongation factor G
MGDIVGDINRRRGQVNDMGDRAGAKTIKADVPLSEMFGYVTTLRTLSSGSNIYYGIFTLRGNSF